MAAFDTTSTEDHRGFAAILAARARQRPDAVAFVFIDGNGATVDQLTFAALDSRARAVAGELVRKALVGERILLVFPSGLDFVVALFACFYAGAVAVPIPHLAGKRTAERIAAIRRDADAAAVLTLSTLGAGSDLQSIGTDVAGLTWVFTDKVAASEPPLPPEGVDADAVALLQYTSGSTGSPKGVMLSQRNLVANSRMVAQAFGHDHTLRMVGWLPLFHDMGLVGHVLQPVYVGGLSVLMSPLTFLQRPIRWLRAISAWKATTSGGPTHGFELCLRHAREDQIGDLDLSSWRVAYCGAEPVRAEVLERFADRFEKVGLRRGSLLPCYGLAEATLFVTGRVASEGLRRSLPRAGSAAAANPRPAVACGGAWGGGAVAIVDPATGVELPDGEVGEIYVSGPHVGQGYWRRDNDSDEVFRAKVSGRSEKYLKTGDLGFVLDGALFVVGRLKNTIIVLGLKHAAEDIEQTVARSHPAFGLHSGAAFAVEIDEREHAVVVQEVGRLDADPHQHRAAVEKAFAAVTREHNLRLFDLVLVGAGTLPRTSSGKLQRTRLRSLYGDGLLKRLNRPPAFASRTRHNPPEAGHSEHGTA